MQANDDNKNEDGVVEGLALLNTDSPNQGAPMHQRGTISNRFCLFSPKTTTAIVQIALVRLG